MSEPSLRAQARKFLRWRQRNGEDLRTHLGGLNAERHSAVDMISVDTMFKTRAKRTKRRTAADPYDSDFDLICPD